MYIPPYKDRMSDDKALTTRFLFQLFSELMLAGAWLGLKILAIMNNDK